MVVFPITDEQAVWMIRQLPVERKMNVLLELLQDADSVSNAVCLAKQSEIRSWFESRMGWDSLSDEERVSRYMALTTIRELDYLSDPEIILDDNLSRMKEYQIRNRAAAVEAITRKNNLENLVAQQEKADKKLEEQYAKARAANDRPLMALLTQEKEQRVAALAHLRESYELARESAEAVKTAILSEESAFRIRTAEAFALKARLKNEPLTEKLQASISALTSDEDEHSWNARMEDIQKMITEVEERANAIRSSLSPYADS